MVTVDGGGDGDFGQAAADELQHGHLSGGVLHGHAVGTQAQVGAAAIDLLAGWVVQVTVDDLLRQRERPPESGDAESRDREIAFYHLKNAKYNKQYLFCYKYYKISLNLKATFYFARILGKRNKLNLRL